MEQKRPVLSSCLIVALALVFFVGLILITITWWKKDSLFYTKDKVGVIEVNGLITKSLPTLKDLRKFQEEDHIKAVVVRIDSPGGAVGPSQEIMREIEKLRKTKKVVASCGTVAASGGYYVACAADLIMANPGTATGSIGVIMKLVNVEELVKKLGVDFYSLQAGNLKDLGSPFRPMNPEERAVLQTLLDDIHQQFIADIARNRKLPVEKVKQLADGSVYTGQKAKELGLVDEMGNFEDAVEKAGRLGGIKGKVETEFPKKPRLSFLNFLLGQDIQDSLNNLAFLYPVPAFLPSWFR
ncbi:MAG: signal peptide peptidase SppA [Deltaproteobacteria bacterium]|nr:signal peptide peptidase SppA [Deltaproteobacteria bacterium]